MQSEDISTPMMSPIYVECDKLYLSKVCVQKFSYNVSGLDIQLEQSENDSHVRKKIGCIWRNTTSHIPFFSIQSYLVVKASRTESGDLGSIPDDCRNSLPHLGHFAWH